MVVWHTRMICMSQMWYCFTETIMRSVEGEKGMNSINNSGIKRFIACNSEIKLQYGEFWSIWKIQMDQLWTNFKFVKIIVNILNLKSQMRSNVSCSPIWNTDCSFPSFFLNICHLQCFVLFYWSQMRKQKPIYKTNSKIMTPLCHSLSDIHQFPFITI